MKRIGKTLLIILTAFMFVMNVSAVFADDEGSDVTDLEESEETFVYDDDFYAKVALVYGEEAVEYMHIVEETVFVPDEAWLNYGSEDGAKIMAEPVRGDERFKTARWDDFPGTGYFDNNTGIRYFPGIYMVGPTDASYSEREKFEVSFCVQPRTATFGVGTSIPYSSVSMANYSMLSDATTVRPLYADLPSSRRRGSRSISITLCTKGTA